jgi:hypothetical protein
VRIALLFGLLVIPAAHAAKPKPASKPPQPAPVSPAPAPAPPPAPLTPAANEPSPKLLQKAAELYASLEYDAVIPLTEVLLQRDDLPIEGKLEAHRLNGSAKAIVQDPVDAEKPFRLLLRLRPDYDLPKDTPPKILSAFRKVQTEERALAAQAELFNREKKIEGLKFLDEPPKASKGGRPLPFSLRLRDPGSAVDTVRVPYRRAGQGAFSSLALQRDEEGKWVGQIPAEYTADEKGFTLEYYVESADAKGALLSEGSAQAPLKVDISAGSLQSGKPPPVHRGVFWAAFAFTLAGGAASGALALTTMFLQRQYSGMMGTVQGAELAALERRGRTTADGTNIALVITGVFAIVTAVLIPFVDWDAAPAQ